MHIHRLFARHMLQLVIPGTARAAGVFYAAVPYGYNHGELIENFTPDLLAHSLDELVLVQ